MPNPLFGQFAKALQSAARREFRSSATGRLLTEVEQYAFSGGLRGGEIRSLTRKVESMLRKGGVSGALSNTETGRIAKQVARYAKSDSLSEQAFSLVVKHLGPMGSMLEALMRPGGRRMASVERELTAATNLLKSFGYRVKKPKRKPQRRRKRLSDTDRMVEELRELGFTVEPPTETKPRRRAVEPEEAPDTRDISIGGRKRSYEPDDPIMTGEMILVESSNVHSIGFIFNHENPMKGTLKVRFLEKLKSRTHGGSVYHYYGVHPDVFRAFQDAASKGKFVWDRIRVRGSVSAHRYQYQLAKLSSSGYVPRQAKRFGGKEYFIGRSVRGKNGRRYKSALADQLVGPALRGSAETGVPNRGLPDRGR